MPNTFTFVHGDPLMVDYTPGGAVPAGDGVMLGGTCRIAHNPIAAGVKDALAAKGGVYDAPRTTGGGTGWADGAKLYVVTATGLLQTSATSATPFGFAVGAAADGDLTGRAMHHPF